MANKEREFLHNTHMRSSTEMLAIRRKFGNEGYAVYFMLLEQFYNSDECSIELSDINIEIIAGDFLVEEKTLFAMIEYFVAI